MSDHFIEYAKQMDSFRFAPQPELSGDGWLSPVRSEKSLAKYQHSLAKYENARKALAEASRVDEVKDIRDKAMAMQVYAKQAKDRELIDHATDIRMRAEIRAGEMLHETAKNKGAVSGKTGRKGKPVLDTTPKLADHGVTKTQSSRWQRLAAMPKAQQEATINNAKRQANAAVEPNHGTESTEEVERFTPPKYIEAARKVLGERSTSTQQAASRRRPSSKQKGISLSNRTALSRGGRAGSF